MMQVFIRFQEPEALEEYLQTLIKAGVDKKNYRQSKNEPNLLTVRYKDEAQFKKLTKRIVEKVKIFGDIEFKPFTPE